MDDDMQRLIGKHNAEIEALQNDMGELKTDVKAILQTLAEAKGGWKTLMLVAGIAGAVGAFLGKLLPFLQFPPK